MRSAIEEEVEQLCRTVGFGVFVAQEDSGGTTPSRPSSTRPGYPDHRRCGRPIPLLHNGIEAGFWAVRPFEDFVATTKNKLVERFTERTTVGHGGARPGVRRNPSTWVRGECPAVQHGAEWHFRTGLRTRRNPTLAVVARGFSTDLVSESLQRICSLVRDAAERVTRRIGGAVPDAPEPAAATP